VLSGDPFRIMKALGAGTQGVIVPVIADADEAACAVAVGRHRREGSAPRSHQSVAALGSSDPEKLAEEVLCLVMVKRGRVSRTWRRSSPPPASTASSLVIPERVVFEKRPCPMASRIVPSERCISSATGRTSSSLSAGIITTPSSSPTTKSPLTATAPPMDAAWIAPRATWVVPA
jgi:hypothetical protein